MRGHARIQKVLSEGVQLFNFDYAFLRERGSISLKADHYWPASETPFNFAGVPMMAQRIMLAW